MRPTRDSLEARLRQLREEFESGKKMIADLEARQATVRDTMLRLSGAIQVLEELLANPEPAPDRPEKP